MKMDIDIILDAIAFAVEKHGKQVRKDAEESAYIRHPIEVAQLLVMAGIQDENVIAAAVLHDVVEDCGVSVADISAMFNPRIGLSVQEVSDDPALDGMARKDAQVVKVGMISPEGKLIKVADKICNLQDVLYRPPINWSIERKAAYFDFAERVFNAANIDNPYLVHCFNNLMEKRIVI